MTWAHFGRDQICTQVNASFSSFGHPTQVNAGWVTSINQLLGSLSNHDERDDDDVKYARRDWDKNVAFGGTMLKDDDSDD